MVFNFRFAATSFDPVGLLGIWLCSGKVGAPGPAWRKLHKPLRFGVVLTI